MRWVPIFWDFRSVYFENATVQNVQLNNICNGSEIYVETVAKVAFSYVNINKSKESLHSSMYFSSASGTIDIENSTFELLNSNNDSDGAFVFLNFDMQPVENTSVTIISCIFACRNVLDIKLGSTSYLLLQNVTANGSCANGSSYEGVAGVTIEGASGLLYVDNSVFYDFHTAVYATNSIAKIFDTVFRNNSGLYIASLEVPHAALGLYNCEAFLSNVTFEWCVCATQFHNTSCI